MKHCKNLVLIGVLTALICTGAIAQQINAQSSTFGFDQSGMDRSVKPGDDFYRYANGGWLDRTEIPADEARVGTLVSVGDTSRARVRGILEQAARAPGTSIGDFYG
jgi:putative endopeptidase